MIIAGLSIFQELISMGVGVGKYSNWNVEQSVATLHHARLVQNLGGTCKSVFPAWTIHLDFVSDFHSGE